MNNRLLSTRTIVFGLAVIGIAAILVVVLSSQPATRPAAVTTPAQSATRVPPGVKPNFTPGPDDPAIYFFEPEDGDQVSSPVYMRIGVQNFNVNNGKVYAHLSIDVPCAAPGERVPTDDSHRFFDKAAFDMNVELSKGAHRLCLQATDKDGVAFDLPGLIEVIDVTVQ